MLMITKEIRFHKFSASALNEEKCFVCHTIKMEHKCEVCSSPDEDIELTQQYGKILFCRNCWDKECKLQAQINDPVEQEKRVEAHNNKMNLALVASRKIDESIQVRTDLFNAATQSIIELKSIIDSDESIKNKPYSLAEELTARFNKDKALIFDYNEKIVEATNRQKATQVYLNQLANTLRAEERAQLKLQDINYNPAKVKPIKPATIKTAAKRLDKIELKKYATELGIPEFTIQMLVVSKGITVEQAANMLRRSINEAKSE